MATRHLDTLHPFDRFGEHSYALLRLAAGILFACHGAQKIFGVLGAQHVAEVGTRMWLAGMIELIGGGLIALGLAASWAGLIASGEMFVAYFIAHAPKGGDPISNGGELALLYAFVFLYVAAHGASAWSVEGLLRGSRFHHTDQTAEARR